MIRLFAMLLLACLAAAGTGTGSARADTVEDFYKGRQIRFLSGYPAGTDYDRWARLFSRHWGRFIPGNPTFLVEYMPGAGGVIVANYISNMAEKQGATILMFERSLPNAALLGDPNIKVDPAKLNWIGSGEQTNRVCAAMKGVAVQKASDLFEKELIVGGAGPGSGFSQTPTLLSRLLGMRFRLTEGYTGAEAAMLAMERGELEGLCNSLSGFRGVRPGWIEKGTLIPLFTMLHEPEPDLKVPTIYEFTKTDEQRQIIDLYMTSLEFGRPVVAPPDVPPERVTALRRSFDAMIADADFRAEATKMDIRLTLRKGEELQEIARHLMATPKDIVEKMKAYMGGK
jgi:tripartite-type tricarboxylate transporter receptor subunit TctC